MSISLKYAVVERERRYLVTAIPDQVTTTRLITDHYVVDTRLRLREVREADGTVVRKLTHKVRLGDGTSEIACTNLYVNEAEWQALSVLPARVLRKTRHIVERDGWRVAVDEYPDGTLVAEIDDGDRSPVARPTWLDVQREVTHDEAWTGAGLASRAPWRR